MLTLLCGKPVTFVVSMLSKKDTERKRITASKFCPRCIVLYFTQHYPNIAIPLNYLNWDGSKEGTRLKCYFASIVSFDLYPLSTENIQLGEISSFIKKGLIHSPLTGGYESLQQGTKSPLVSIWD